MVGSKTFLQNILIGWVLLPVFSLCSVSVSAQSEWLNFTSFNNVRQMRVINDTLYAATSGGLLAITDFNKAGLQFINTDGLGTNDITDIIEDASGQKWVTGFGRLIRFDSNNSKQYLFFDNDDNLFQLHRVVDDSEYLWIGTDIGLVLFSKTVDDGQIQDSYQLFGNLNPSPTVNDILLKDDSIWIATSNGLAAAVRTDPNLLKSPSSWTVFGFGDYPELGTDTILGVVAFEGNIYINTPDNLFRFNETTFVNIPYASGVTASHIFLENDTLFIFYQNSSGGGIAFLKDSTLNTVSTNGLPSSPLTGITYQSNRWVAVKDSGIFYDNGNTFDEYIYTGLLSNDISDITVNQNSVITAGFRRVSAATLVDSVWIKHNFGIAGGITKIISDSSGNPWVATRGNGLWFINGDSLINYDENNSSLRGPITNDIYIMIYGLVTDGNYLYASSLLALNNYPIAIADLNNLDNLSGWDSIGVTNGLNENAVGDIDLYNGQLAVASDANGIYLCSVGENPLVTNITCQHFTRENSLLISNIVRVVRFSPDGILWVGTNLGLSRFDPGIDRFVEVSLPPDISSDITILEFDKRGNLWIGTKDGLARLDATTATFTVYNSFNSSIASNLINSLTYDNVTGNLYVGTNSGFTVIPSEIGKPVYNIGEVNAFPNPYIISSGNELLNFNFGSNGKVQIFNVAGELVRELSVNMLWDGINSEGKNVVSGVYIFVITDDDGNIGRGKFLLIRK